MNRSLPFLPILAVMAASALLASCAAGYQTPPPGGPPDTTAPAIVGTTPLTGTVNFHEQTVTATFDEDVNEASVQNAVVVTPIPVEPLEFDWSGRTLEVTFAKPLLENRTYAVTFGSSITDLSNNRLGRPFTLRFATGEHIDSGRIVGEVIGRAPGKAFIYAYLAPEDSARFNAAFRPDSLHPDFIAPIGDDGTFTLEGLPLGVFRLMAVVDAYGDQLYSPGQDAYGIAVADVRVASQTEAVTGVAIRLRPAPDDLTPPALYSARSIGPTHTELKFSEPIAEAGLRAENFSIEAAGARVQPTAAWRTQTSPLVVHLVHPALSANAEVTVSAVNLRDTVGNAMPDSASHATFTVVETPDTAAPTLLPLPVDTVKAYAFPDSILITFDAPVRAADLDGALAIRDTAGARARFRLAQRSPSEFVGVPLDTLSISGRATIEVQMARFPSPSGAHRDSIARIPIMVALLRQSGTLEGTLEDSASPAARHVITVRAVGSGPTFTLRGIRNGPWSIASLPEGEYEVTAFRDDDGNGLYSYGSITPYRPAEAYMAWHGTVRIRPRWTTNKVDLVIR